MHRIAATPGGWNPDEEGVIFVEQTPAPRSKVAIKGGEPG